MELPVAEETTWWCLKAGREGVLEDDWLDRRMVSTGWGHDGPDFRETDCEEFQENDPSHLNQLSKFVGCHDDGMEEGDMVIAYAPGKGHLSGVGEVGEINYDDTHTFRYLSEEEASEAQVDDHYYWRPISWFDWDAPVLVSDLPKRYQVNGADQIPTPMTLNQYGTLAEDRDRIETLAKEVQDAETVVSSGGGFGPEQESQIQEWVTDNVRELGVYNPRREVRTEVGRIDILAEDDNGEAIIEIKHGRAGDRALGQLLGYMGARQSESTVPVRGLLIAESFTTRVQQAVSVLEAVSLHEFTVQTSVDQV